MSLPVETRRQIIISHEGQILSHVGSSGISMTGDLARCYLDGAINALIRLEGAEAATQFAFALSDRAAGGLRGETAIFPLPSMPVEAVPVAQTSSLAAAVATTEDEDDTEDDDAGGEPTLIVRTHPDIPLWFFYWALTIACFAGWIVGRAWPI